MSLFRDQRLSLEQNRLLSKARVLGPATALPVLLSDSELLKIIGVIGSDTGLHQLVPIEFRPPLDDYFQIPLSWFNDNRSVSAFNDIYIRCITQVQNFDTYFKCLCELHKRRKKYDLILSAQPLPTMLQVSPRALLEFGRINQEALASWLTWRKWFYDVDNRAAQETGYLFEPILANALGGTPYGAKNSPVKRRSDQRKGRQVDCIVDTLAYEFKLRVTIAASGQGRFGEELDFAEDCKASGFTPMIVVLDPTPSTRLTELVAEFTRAGGGAYVGPAAWQHLEQQAGSTMATFLERYVRRPIEAMDQSALRLLDLSISRAPSQYQFCLRLGTHEIQIARHELAALADDGDDLSSTATSE